MIHPYPVDQLRHASELAFPVGAILIHGTHEERSVIPDGWHRTIEAGSIHELTSGEERYGFRSSVTGDREYNPRRRKDLEEFLRPLSDRDIYLDFTGLSHHIWMPLVRLASDCGLNLHCIYSEPASYRDIPVARVGDFFDLSERIEGISPVPGFSFLSDQMGRPPLLVPLLGFEGTRFKHILEALQPEGDDILPIVGVPGFQADFAFHAFRGNAEPLRTQRAWGRVRYADASCPFSLFERLEGIRAEHRDKFLQISMTGTKPHALGAALFAISHDDVELVYDHPIRKRDRSSGTGPCHVYHVTDFLASRGEASTRS